MKDAADFPALLETFFTRRLIAQRKASPHTIASYRDTFHLLLQFAEQRLAKAPSRLTIEDLNAPFLGVFLDHLESARANGARSRNLRLTGIRSFFRFAALETPQHAGLIQRVLAIPNKRQSRPLVGFLNRPEIDALLAAPDRATWLGRRDHTLLLTAVQTGLRLAEITSIRQHDVSLATGPHVRCEGKGRKERCTPLTKSTVTALRTWIREQGADGTRILFPSVRGNQLSADAVQHGREVRCRSTTDLSIAGRQAYFAPCPPTHHSDGVDAGWGGPDLDSTVAGSRIRRNHADIPGRRSGHQGERPVQTYSNQYPGRAFSTRR
jgi:integrase/recombinase XerD